MTQNTSHAVMAQRHEAPDSLDHFPTPPWATRALCHWLELFDSALSDRLAWDPACAEGYMSRPLSEYFGTVARSDIFQYGDVPDVFDFLAPFSHPKGADWIITNPPFRLGEEFALRGLSIARLGVALLVRTAFLESASRFESLFSSSAPTEILQFVERVPMQKGILNRKGSTATAYCWLVWRKSVLGQSYATEFHWLAPCRKRLERDSDYPSNSEAA